MILRPGTHGPGVEAVQQRLGLPEAGSFDSATARAVAGFQRRHGLRVDAAVGPVTLEALDLPALRLEPFPLERVEVRHVAPIFPEVPRERIARHLPHVLRGLQLEGIPTLPMLRVALATIRAEVAGFEPIAERRSRYNTAPGCKPFALYDGRRDLGNLEPGDGRRFRGRGFVQLTGRANYRRYGERLGIPLETMPDRALEPATAGRILAAFLGDRRLQLRLALLQGDLAAARRLVNGGTHGLRRFVEAYEISRFDLLNVASSRSSVCTV